MITREQVADLRPGDVVEITDHLLCTMRGPLREGRSGGLILGAFCIVRYADGGAARPGWNLTVISRAPRLYVNHDRTEPVQGDVVRFLDKRRPDDAYTNLYDPRGDRQRPWLQIDGYHRWSHDQAIPTEANRHHYDLILLVDGETGQAVTP